MKREKVVVEIVCAAGGCEVAIEADAAMTDYKESYREGHCPGRVMEDVADNAFDYFRDNPAADTTTIVDSDGDPWECVKFVWSFDNFVARRLNSPALRHSYGVEEE